MSNYPDNFYQSGMSAHLDGPNAEQQAADELHTEAYEKAAALDALHKWLWDNDFDDAAAAIDEAQGYIRSTADKKQYRAYNPE